MGAGSAQSRTHVAPRRRRFTLRRPALSLVVHAVSFAWFLMVFSWHCTPAAAHLPGAQGFGWFIRYLTFWSYSLQTLTLGLALVDDLCVVSGRKSSGLADLADDMSCALFALTHVVSLMFYAIQGTTKMAVEGGYHRPPFLDVSVHALNTLTAWVDLLTSRQRTFSRRSEGISSVVVATYLGYILLCRHRNGRFPYPFLNAMRFPSGFVGVAGAGLAIFGVMFRAGKALCSRLEAVEQLTVELVEEAVGGGEGGPTAAAAAAAHLHAAEAAISKGKLL